MRYKITLARPTTHLRYDGTMSKRPDEFPPETKLAVEAYQREMGFEVAEAKPALTRKQWRRARPEREFRRQQLEVLRTQGVPLREEAALRWLAEREFWEAFRLHPRAPSVAQGITFTKLVDAAGGVLPPGMMYLASELTAKVNAIAETRAKRDAQVLPRFRTGLRDRFDDMVRRAAKEAIHRAEFRKPDEFSLSCQIGIIGHGISPRINFERSRPSKKSVYIFLDIPRTWHRTVFRAGLANVFGPRTLVLAAHVGRHGTRVTVAVQSRGAYKLKVVEGWLSRNEKHEPILKLI